MTTQLNIHAPYSFLTSENLIRSICNPALEQIGISFFYFLRIYNNNSYCILTNNNKIIEYIFSEFIPHNIPLIAPPDPKVVSNNFRYLILPNGPYIKVVHDMKSHLNIAYCLNILEHNENYIDAYCFGSTPDNENIINFYLNNFDYLEKFKSSLKKKLHSIITPVENNPFLVPDMIQNLFNHLGSDFNYYENNIPTDNILTDQYKHIQFSERQLECLSQLIVGRTAKQTAKELGLSFRTIEHYLQDIKIKLGCHRKSEIIDILLKYSSKNFLSSLSEIIR